MLLVPILLTSLMDEFSLSLVQITSLWTMCYFVYGISALPGGFLADKWSCKAVLIIFFIGTPLAVTIIGAARTVLNLSIGMVVLGVSASLFHPSALAMVSHGVRERGKAMGIQGVFGNVGLAFSPIIVGSLASVLSWRYACFIISIPSFIALAVFVLVSRKVEVDRKIDKAPSNANPKEDQPHPFRVLIILYAAMALAGFTYQV